ncbi:hypothetical protein WL51_06965 [Burkholderia ubonensis]|nr:hypothetical protein WL51_06965 [Burkholderia ubonensis]
MDKIGAVSLSNTAYHVGEGCRRSAALLRSLHYQLINATTDEINVHDVEALVGMALSAIPDPDDDAFSAIERFGSAARESEQEHVRRQEAMNAVLDALECAARPDATLNELEAAAGVAYANAALLPNGERRWEAFCSLIQTRGLFVDWIQLFDTVPPTPTVNSAETRRASRTLRRKSEALTVAAKALTLARSSA